MSAPDRIWAAMPVDGLYEKPETLYGWQLTNDVSEWEAEADPCAAVSYLREDGPTITAYREALRLLRADPDSIAREAEKEAQ